MSALYIPLALYDRVHACHKLDPSFDHSRLVKNLNLLSDISPWEGFNWEHFNVSVVTKWTTRFRHTPRGDYLKLALLNLNNNPNLM